MSKISRALITKRKSPKVITVIGIVSKIRMGFSSALNIASKKATTRAMKKLSTYTPGNIYARNNIIMVVINNLIKKKADINAMSKDFSIQLQYSFGLIENIAKYYEQEDLVTKQRIIGSIFPKLLVFTKQGVRTNKVNDVIKLFSPDTAELELKQKGLTQEKSHQSCKVILLGFEPRTPCLKGRCSTS